MIAVNGTDDAQTIQQYWRKSKFTMKAGMAEQREGGIYDVGERYGVLAYPTNYLVGSDGTILWRGVGFVEAELRNALAMAGLR